MIGNLEDPFTSNILNPSKLIHDKTIRLDFNPSSCCEYINQQILVADSEHNCLKIFKFNRKFCLLKTLHNIGDCAFNRPAAIKLDSQNKYVFLCLSERIVIIDIFLEKILAEIILTLFRPGASSSFSSLFSTNVQDLCLVNANKLNSLFILYQSKIFGVKYSSHSKEEVHIKKIDDSSFNAAVEAHVKKPEHIASFGESIAIHIGQKIMIYSFKSGLIESNIQVDNEAERIHSMFFCEDGTKVFLHLNENGIDKLACFARNDLNEWERKSEVNVPTEIGGSWNLEFIHGKLVIVPWSRNLIIFS